MSENHFTIERNGRCWESVDKVVVNKVNMIQSCVDELRNSTYDQMKSKHWIEGFIIAVMETANELSGTEDDKTIVTLVDENNVFIWSILIGPCEGDMYQYVFIDWKKDGKNYRYE